MQNINPGIISQDNSSAITNDNAAFPKEKPYDVCLTCPFIGKSCDGPNFLAMSPERWGEWIKARKKIVGLTHIQIADIAEVGTATVNRILAGHVADIRLSTMRAVTKAVINGSWGEFPCHNSGEINDMIKLSKEEIQELANYRKDQCKHEEEMKAAKESHDKATAFLIKQHDDAKATIRTKEQRITILSVVSGLLAVALIVSLII